MDVDGNSTFNTNDGWMIYRYKFFSGFLSSAANTTNNNVLIDSQNATRNADEIQSLLASGSSVYDVDGNGTFNTNDGWMIYRYKFFSGFLSSATNTTNSGALIDSQNATRTAEEIQQYIADMDN